MTKKTIRIGTRGSKLALYQAHRMQDELKATFPEISSEIVIIKTKGDKILDIALSKIGDKGLFTKELEVALMAGEIDLAVHSLKDMPTQLPEGLILAAVLERGEVNDAFVSLNKRPLREFGPADKIATSSLRRIAGLKHINPDLNIVDIRGNVITRIQKMKDGYCDAMIMAATGLRRLGLDEHITEVLPVETIMPAIGQGAIGIEVVEKNKEIQDVLLSINHNPTWMSITAERAFMKSLQGGCQVPIGCFSTINNNELTLEGFVASVDGKDFLKEKVVGNLDSLAKIGIDLAEKIRDLGGDAILAKVRAM